MGCFVGVLARRGFDLGGDLVGVSFQCAVVLAFLRAVIMISRICGQVDRGQYLLADAVVDWIALEVLYDRS